MIYKIKIKKLVLSLILLFFFSDFASAVEYDDLGGIDMHGGVSFGYMHSDNNNLYADTSDGTFQFSDMYLSFAADATDRLHAAVQLYSYDLGTMNNYKVFLDRAFLSYDYKEWLNISGGLIKIPHGLYNESRDSDYLRVNVLLPQCIYQDSWRDVIASVQGISAFGEFDMNTAGIIAYNFEYGVPNIDEDTGVSRFLSDMLPGMLDADVEEIDVSRAYAGSLFWETPLDGLKIGVTGYKIKINLNTALSIDGGFLSELPAEMLGPMKDIPVLDFLTGIGVLLDVNPLHLALDVENYVLSTEYIWNNFTFAAEYAQQKINIGFDSIGQPMSMLLEDTGTVLTVTTEGYYGSIAYRFSELFELGVYYGEYYPDKSDKDGTGNDLFTGLPKFSEDNRHRAWQKDACMTFRFDIAKNVALKLEGHVMDGTAQINRADNSGELSEDWFLFAAKCSYVF